MSKDKKERSKNRYHQLVEKIFFDKYVDGDLEVLFERLEINSAAKDLGIELPSNVGDVIYSIRFRTPMPESILLTQPEGKEWIIELAGRSKYRFRLVTISRILPNPNMVAIKIPDNTPEIITGYSLDDEQALLAKVRYNRLIDIFLGITTYSLQNHLRTTVKAIGQIEIDELYVGIDKYGCHYIIPVQAKGGTDQISMVQTSQDTAWCEQKYPNVRCRAISAQFVSSDLIALFELKIDEGQVKLIEERHYKLVPAKELDSSDISNYRMSV